MTAGDTKPQAIADNGLKVEFEGGEPERQPAMGGFVVDLEGFEGPLDLLLNLARRQKVDLTGISILQLAEQFLGYIEQARKIRLEVAADYLVMAAWLAYLKSRLLLPDLDDGEEPSGEELAARLQHQLRRLEAMREVSEQLMGRRRLGVDTFARGAPEGIRVIRQSTYECSLFELLDAYGRQVSRTNVTTFKLRPLTILSVEAATVRLRDMLGHMPDWSSLETFLPAYDGSLQEIERRSSLASILAGGLELVKQGQIKMRQNKTFGPIFLKTVEPEGGGQ